MTDSLPLGLRLEQLAAERGDVPAVIGVGMLQQTETITWHELNARSEDLARRLTSALPAGRPAITVRAANTVAAVVELVAVLRAGFVAAPMDPYAPTPDLDARIAVLEQAAGGFVALDDALSGGAVHHAASRLPRQGGYLLLTGGTSGTPKPVHYPGVPAWNPRVGPPLLLRATGWQPHQTHLVVGPIHHSAPFTHLLYGLLSGCTLVLPAAFYPELMFDLVRRHRIQWMQMTPTHMRMCDPALPVRAAELDSLVGMLHTAAPCPADTKRRWLDALGPDRVNEMYAATEGMGVTLCRGRDWLRRPGTVGRGLMTRIRIRDAAGRALPPGEIGVVHMRGTVGPNTGHSLAAPVGPARGDGYATAGDLGWIDEDGFLFLAGRPDDLVISGGENVYTNDVVDSLLHHPDIADACVRPSPDDLMGTALTAVIQPRRDSSLTEGTVLEHCRARLSPSKIPTTVRIVDRIPRSAAGKLLRGELDLLLEER